MYKKIAQHPGTRKLYGDKLVAQGVLQPDGPDAMVKVLRAAMDAGKSTYDPVLTNYKSKYSVDWAPFLGRKWTDAADTALPLAEVKRLAERLTTLPSKNGTQSTAYLLLKLVNTGSLVVKPIWLLMTMCTVPPVK